MLLTIRPTFVLRFLLVSAALEGLRKRKGNLTMSTDHKLASKMIGFEIEPGEEVVTDHAKDGGFQKVVQFTKDLTHIVTAGADGYFRIWQVSYKILVRSILI